MKPSFIVALILLLPLPALFAQQQETKVIPPSPEASSVFKFAEVPVSAFTGLPNISVPLYNIQLKQLNIPIQLSYHARGIRVEEIAPRVGLGWALSYGGMISRQVRDRADDHSGGYLYQNYYNGVFTDASLRGSMAAEYNNNTIDMTPDQFFLDMNGESVKFVFDQSTGEILQQKYSETRITPVNGEDGIGSWIVVDDQGNTYYYGKSKDGLREAVDYDQLIKSFVQSWPNGNPAELGNNGDERTINSWHLMEIETPFNERVQFFYEPEDAQCFRRSYDNQKGSDVTCHFSHTTTRQQQIEHISFDNGKVTFSKSASEREDLVAAHVLENVSVYKGQNTLLKEYLFQYHYTTSPDDDNQLPYLKAMDPKSSKRLFLESIQEKGRAAETLPPYTFQYNPILLPNRFSNSQDNWGFYNGKNNGPYLTFFQYRNAPVSRKVDVTLSAAGLLTSMTYPTGGSVAYTYEHNLVDPPAYMNELLYPEKTITETVPKGISMIKNSQYYDAGNNVYSIPVTIGAGVTGAVEFEIDLPYCSEPSGESYCQYQVYLRGQGNDYYLYPMVPASRERSLGLSPGTYTLEVIPGPPHDPSEIENLFLVTLDWNEIVNSNEQSIPTPIGGAPLLAAGKRIGKIEYKNGDGTILRKKYSYLVPELNLPKTSGKLFGLPNFYYIKRTDMIGGVPIPTIDAYGSLPGTPLASLQGNSVGYSHVTEYYGDSLVNHGKTEYEFTTTQDGGTYYTFPYHVPVDNEWLRGKSTATRYYERNSGGTYSLKKAVTNSYLYAGSASGPELFMPPASSTAVYSKTRTNFYLPLLIFKEEAPGYKIYYLTGGTCDLYSTTETYYDQDLPKLTKQTNYLHDYARHYQLRGSENIMSDGTKETAITSYPNDYAAGTAFIDNMKTNNLHAYPIEEVLYKEAGGVRTILSGKITRYNDSNPALAAQVLSLENAGPVALSAFKFSSRLTGELPPDGTPSMFAPHSAYKPVLTYDQYDASGNVLQHTKTDDMRVSYLWDYRNQYPIAEVKNAQQADIAYTSFEADGKGNWSFAGTPQPDNTSPGGEQAYNLGAGGITRSLLSTTKKYTLSFWAKSSQPPGVTGGAGASISAPEVLASANGWTRFGYEVTNTASVAISGSVLIDEVRLHPAVAQMSTYTYDPLTGMTSGTDPNGTTSYFKYDGLNRLQYVKDKDGNILKYYQYHYAQD